MWAANREFIEIAEYLLESGANINSVNGENTTAIMYVAKNQNYNLEMVKLLLKYNPDLNLKD